MEANQKPYHLILPFDSVVPRIKNLYFNSSSDLIEEMNKSCLLTPIYPSFA